MKLGVPGGGHIPDIRMLSPSPSGETRICAPAYTVQMVLASDKDAPKPAQHFVDSATEGSIIVIDVPPQAKNAAWVGLMTAGAQARRARGVVISGRCRDLAEHRAANFPVFARGSSTVGQSPFTRPSAVNVTLNISTGAEEGSGFPPTMKVEPGDWVLGDEDGVVCVPREMTEKVVELAQVGREVDAKCLADIKSGLGVAETFKRHRGK